MEIKTIGVVGAGQMGNGIAQVARPSGFNVIMNDIADAFVQKGPCERISKNLDRMVEKGKISSQKKEEIMGKNQGNDPNGGNGRGGLCGRGSHRERILKIVSL